MKILKKYWGTLALAILAVLAFTLILQWARAGAGQVPQDLQPTFRLMDGDRNVGLVYGLDSGWVVMNIDKAGNIDSFYTCGCFEGVCNVTEAIPTPTPDVPTPPPPPTPTATATPEDESKANCGLGNNEEGADPNDNACGKKTGEENEPDGPPGQG
jgi:hypothetical protein